MYLSSIVSVLSLRPSSASVRRLQCERSQRDERVPHLRGRVSSFRIANILMVLNGRVLEHGRQFLIRQALEIFDTVDPEDLNTAGPGHVERVGPGGFDTVSQEFWIR